MLQKTNNKKLAPAASYLSGFQIKQHFETESKRQQLSILMVDNYDSFTYNLVHYLKLLDAKVQIVRNDETFLMDKNFITPFDVIVLSPGPSDPQSAGLMTDFIRKFDSEKAILGICLGMQALGICNGANLIKSPVPRHGKTDTIFTIPHPVFKGITKTFEAMRYHSLALNFENTNKWNIIGRANDGVPMVVVHVDKSLAGIQFHPESILTEDGFRILENALDYTFMHHSSKLR